MPHYHPLTYASLLISDSNNGKLCNINGRFKALFDPAYKQGICYYTVKHPTFKKVAVSMAVLTPQWTPPFKRPRC